MAYSNDPICAQSVHTAQKTLTAAKSTLSGVTNATSIFQAPASEGVLITRVWARPLATVATALRADLYISPDASAATLVDCERITVTGTIDATTDIAEVQFDKWSEEDPLYLGPGEYLYAGLSAAFASGVVIACQYQQLTAATVA